MRFPPLPALVVMVLALSCTATALPAQDGSPTLSPLAPPDTLTEAHGWLSDVVVTLNLTQSAYQNWQEGGFNTLAATANLRSLFGRVQGDFR